MKPFVWQVRGCFKAYKVRGLKSDVQDCHLLLQERERKLIAMQQDPQSVSIQRKWNESYLNEHLIFLCYPYSKYLKPQDIFFS